MRVFLGLTEVSGYYAHLRKGFEQIGVDCVFVDLSGHRFGYGGATDWWSARTLVRLATARRGVMLRIVSLFLRGILFVHAAATCDVFVFGYLTTFFRFRELPLLKLLGKRIIYVFHGSDSRAPYLDGYQQQGLSIDALIAMTAERKRAIATVERYADAIVCTPIHTHLHEKPVIGFQRLGVPVEYDEESAGRIERRSGATRILHAPSAPENKGTPAIRAAIERLRTQGYDIEYIELTGRPHAEVVAELQACDFVVDQLYGEGPIGGFATEAAFHGKPAVLGTHTDEIWRIYEDLELPPVVRCANEEVEAAIRRLIDDPEFRIATGQRAREIVHTRWTPRQVAANFRRILTGDVPVEWMFDPQSLRDVHGAGLSKDRLQRTLAEYIERGGVAALQLADKPRVERELVTLSGVRAG